jgi:hypothetical protein
VVEIKFEVDDAKVQKVIDTMIWLYPIPEIDNPKFISEEETPNEPKKIPEFTESQWAKESLRRFIIKQVQRKDIYDAKSALNIAEDDSLVQ